MRGARKQVARSFLPANTAMRDKHDNIMPSMNVIHASDNIRRLHTMHYMLDIKRPVLTTWINIRFFYEKGCHTNLFHEKGCQAGLQRRMTKYMLGTWYYYYLNTTAVHYWDISDCVDLYLL